MVWQGYRKLHSAKSSATRVRACDIKGLTIVNTTPRKTFLALLGTGVASAALLSTPAFAQTGATVDQTAQASADEADTAGSSIIVTGSRISRTEVESPVPIAVVGQAILEQDAAQNISDTINELPQVAIGSTRTNTNFQTTGTGIATVNLRSLGSSRTLTLVNGRRFISGFAGDSAVDLNNIPTDFVDRVEVVTGGSSAVYGSEAIAGVVNFILKDKFDGLQLRLQTGITSRGDNPTYLGSLTGGQSFMDGRLNLLGNFSWDKDEGLASRDRKISQQDCGAQFSNGVICGPAFYSSFASQGRFQLVSSTGSSRPVLPGGNSLFTFNPDNSLQLGFPIGFGFNRDNLRLISTPVERKIFSGIVNFEVTPSIKFFTELTYGRVKSDASIEPLAVSPASTGVNRIGISNPFIPASVAATIAAVNSDAIANNNVGFIDFRRRSNEIFDRSNHARRNTFRAATGFKGELAEKYNWEVSYVYGRVRDFNSTEDIDLDKYNNALDAVRVSAGNVVGTDIICRDAAARAAGCIPLNLFGANTVDPRAAAYVKASVPRSEDIINREDVVNASISGPLFALWAGDISAAVGGEYRREKTSDTVDALTLAGNNSGNQLTNLVGKYHVWEAFGEVNVPLIKDSSFTKYFGLTGAARYSDYSTIGGIFSYNVGAEWQPISDIRFRGMYAVANRAPNISELFSQPSQTFAAINDPCNGVTATTAGDFGAACRAIPGVASAINANGAFVYTLADLQTIDGFVGGNTNLSEEKATTKTLGVVLTPRFIPGLSLTADYYDIKVKNAINTLGRNFSVSQCLLTNNPVFCSTVTRNPNTGFITRVNGQLINVAGLHNEGIDFGLNYGTRVGLVPDDKLTLAVNVTHLIDNETQSSPSEAPSDSAGTFGRGFSRNSALARGSYRFNEFTIGWTTSFLEGGPFVKDFFSTDPAVVALNKVDDYWLHDFQLRIDPNDRFSMFFNVDNVFDTKPQLLPGAAFGNPTGLETSPDFDVFGRRFLVGVKVKFF